jgi:hypothetical protein
LKEFDRVRRKFSPSWPSLENILPELKTVLPNACLRQGFGRQADFVIEGYVDPPSRCATVDWPARTAA